MKTDQPLNSARVMRWYPIVGGLLIVTLLLTAGIGLFGSNIYDAFAPPKYVQESRAQDAITLGLGIPLMLLAMWGLRRQRAWAVPLWAGVLAYELYVYAIYAFGGIYNRLFPGYLLAASLCLYTLIGLLSTGDRHGFPTRRPALPRRWIAGFFSLIVLVFGVIWLGEVLASIERGAAADGHLIVVIDLVIVLPAFGIAAYQLLRRRALGDLLAGMLLIKFVSLCLSIILGQIFRAMHTLAVETELLSIFIPLGLIGLGLVAVYFWQLNK